MNISRDEAREALTSVQRADAQVSEVRNYAYASPFLLLWGVIWVIANSVADFRPELADKAWLVGMIVGFVVTIALIVRLSVREHQRNDPRIDRRVVGRRVATLGLAVWAYFPAMLLIVGPLSPRQVNAFISLFWALGYMVAGAWIGLRLTIIGAVTAIAIVVGYVFVQEHFPLWMAVFGGGSLIAAGLWLRKI